MPLTNGDKLGSYEILGPLGAGGMGEVYRAKDTKLDREVAVKVLPEALAQDPDRLARFEREAKVLASLNHPNIAQIYGIEDRALIMELVPGETLKGPLPLATALNYAKQIAEALEAAHDKGITHRDLKPGNIMVTPAGVVKVLDFGLAAVGQSADASKADPSKSPTLTMRETSAGFIMGTAAYMSPEQASGKPVDKRSDIWSFGVVLHEILTGTRLFHGETISHTLAHVLTGTIDFDALPKDTPRWVRDLLRRCLNRDLKFRLQAIGEARIAIETPRTLEPAAVPQKPSLLPWMLAAAMAVIALAALGAFAYARRQIAVSPPVTRLFLGLQPAESLLGAQGTNSQARPTRAALAWSPDGRSLVFGAVRAGVQQLYLRRLEQLQASPISGTEGAIMPFFSPDGAWLGFWAAGELKKVSTTGGPPVTICKTNPVSGATWADGDLIFFSVTSALRGGIRKVLASGGDPETVVRPDPSKGEYSYSLPHALPGGKALLFTMTTEVQRWEDAQIFVRLLATGQQFALTQGVDAHYISTGHLIFARQGALLAAPFDVATLRLTGGAAGVADDIMQALNAPSVPLETGAAQFDVSPSGSLAYAPGGILEEEPRLLVWVDRAGVATPLPLPPKAYWGPRLAPDGKRLSFYTRGTDQRIWITDLDRGTSTPFSERGSPSFTAWTPDSLHLTFMDRATRNLFWRRADGSGEPERLTTSPNEHRPGAWSPDGELLALVESDATGPQSETRIAILSRGGKEPAHPWRTAPLGASNPDWSPDGRWMVYTSEESGRSEVYVQPYPGPGARYPVSRDGGTNPAWSHDGQEIFYLVRGKDEQVTMVTTPVTMASGLPTEPSRKLFTGRYAISALTRSYDVTADGKRFMMVQRQDQAPRPVSQIIVVQNWTEELKRLVPNK